MKVVTISELLSKTWNTKIKEFNELSMTSINNIISHHLKIQVIGYENIVSMDSEDIPFELAYWETKDNELWVKFKLINDEELPEWIVDLDDALEKILKHKGKIREYYLNHTNRGVESDIFHKILKSLRNYDLI